MKPLENKHPDIRAFYVEGKQNEKTVALWLMELGYEVKASTWEEDFYQDIDIWVRVQGTEKWRAASIKTNDPEYQHSPFIFELERKGANGWYPVWYKKGKAEIYLVWKRNYMNGGDLYVISKKQLQNYVTKNGWDATAGHKPDVAEREKKNNLFGVRLGLLLIENALENGIARLLSQKRSIIKKREAAS